jgi:hypothetical protein
MSGDWKSGGGDGSGDKGGTWDPDATRAWTPGPGKDEGGFATGGKGFGDATPASFGGGQDWGGAVKDAAQGFAVDPRSAGHEGTFTETTTTSFGSRIKGALTGVLIGLALVPGSAYLLFWNEGRAVQTAQSLTEGAGAVQAAEAGRVEATQEGRLVHVTGPITVQGTLRDPDFGVQAAGAVRLVRSVEMFQWREERRSETRTQLGGAQETVTTYSYTRGWSSTAINSSGFRQPEGRLNPPLRFEARNTVAPEARLGARRLTEQQLAGFGSPAPIALDAATFQPPSGARVMEGGLYLGRDPGNPQVGDMRIRFAQVPAGPASIIARQAGDGFAPYQTRAGDSLFMLRAGAVPASEMFAAAQSANATMTWILRLVGCVLMYAAFGMILRPLPVLGSVVPFIGSIIGVGTGLVSLLLTVILAPLVIAVAWIWFRPLVGTVVLLLGIGAAVGVSWLISKRKAAMRSAPAAA